MTNTTNIKLPVSQPELAGNEKKYVLDCLDSNWISSSGKYVKLFEDKFSEYLGVKHSESCCNGTAALHLALLALGIGGGDEVIVPAFTYVATANSVYYTGATPVFADCEPDTGNIDPKHIKHLITGRTKAIVVVPLYGHPCDMDLILEVARKHKIFVVEDAAEALGARYKGKLCGSMADISTFSFYGNKTITTGEGGMVVTNDENLAAKVRLFKGQGMDPSRRYWFPVVGYNYRMTNIEAAIGLAQLENVESFLAKRLEIAGYYNNRLKSIKGIALPVVKEYAVHSWWMYSILIEQDYGVGRDQVISMLADKGIETRPFFYPMHKMPVYANSVKEPLDNAVILSEKGINLPTFTALTKDDIIYIASVIDQVAHK